MGAINPRPGGTGGGGPVTIADISDAGAAGADVLAASTAAVARAAIGVDEETLASDLAHTPTSATMRFLWRFDSAGGTATNRGTIASSNLTLGGSAAQNALLLASLNGRGLSLNGSAGCSASGGAGATPGVSDGLTWWAVFTVTTPPSGRRATVFTRAYAAAWTNPWLSLSIMADNASSGTPRAIYVQLGHGSGDYREHQLSVPYVDGVQMSVVCTLSGTTWKAYVNGVLVNTFSNGASVDWGPGNGLWFVGDNSNTNELTGHVTEAGCDARVWTADDVIELEQRRLGRWRG